MRSSDLDINTSQNRLDKRYIFLKGSQISCVLACLRQVNTRKSKPSLNACTFFQTGFDLYFMSMSEIRISEAGNHQEV